MPRKPNVPCQHPGCPELVAPGTRYCAKHKTMHPEVTRSEARRIYKGKWSKVAKQYLESHPLCVRCMADGKYTKATVVDHVRPHRGDKTLFWDRSNWQALCKKCHDKKTLTEDIHPTYRY